MENLAPNGKKSNLSAENYKLVRSLNFKNRFGDWENNPTLYENELDENGEPIIIEHEKDNIYEQRRIVKGTINAKPITYTIDNYSLDTAYSYLTEWKMQKWVKEGKSEDLINRDIENAKIEIRYVTERTPFTTWFLDIPKGKYTFDVLDASYEIKKEIRKEKVEIGWKSVTQNKTYWYVVKTNDVISPFDEFIISKKEYEKKEAIIVDINFKFQNLIYKKDILDYPLPNNNYNQGGLLAPNLQPSNLTPEQWHLVRTPEFKAWFGDWENEPKNASKVVDENGEPMVVFHGAKNKFYKFKKKKNNSDQNPFYVNGFWFFADPIGKSLSDEDREYFYNEGNAKYMAENWVTNEDGQGIAKVLECFLNVRNPIKTNSYAQFLYYQKENNIINSIKNKEKDGWFIHGSRTDGNLYRDDINVFESTQIKLADGTNITFDGNNPDIRYKVGGSLSKTPSPLKDRIKGSKVNKKGSAASNESAFNIEFVDSTINTLKNKMDEYNEKHPKNKVSLSTLKAVFRRGAGAYSTSHRPTIMGGKPNSRSAWAFARVNKFLLKKGGTKVKAAYIQDDDLMEYGGKVFSNDDGLYIKIKNVTQENRFKGAYKKIFDIIENSVSLYNPYGTDYEEIKGNDLHIFITPRPDYTLISQIEKIKNIEIIDLDISKYDLGGIMSKHLAPNGKIIDLGQEITCINCGWHWNTKQSDEFDKYICHNCGFDNRTFYDSEPIGEYKEGGMLKQPHTIYQIAKKHNVSLNVIKDALKDGINTEKEHTNDISVAKTISLHHLYESPSYYNKLQKMEKSFKQGGEIIEHGYGKIGGVLVGRRHSEGGIKAINKANNQPLEMEGGEVVITRNAVSDNKKREFEGKMMTNKEILSAINESGGGVSFAKGGKTNDCGCSGKQYKYGGKMMTDFDIVESIQGTSKLPNRISNALYEMTNLRYAELKPSEAMQKLFGGISYENGGTLEGNTDYVIFINKRLPSLKGFLNLKEKVKSPFDNDNEHYVPIKQNRLITFARGGNVEFGKITNVEAYKTYLFDNYGIKFKELPVKIQNALFMGEQSIIDKYINE